MTYPRVKAAPFKSLTFTESASSMRDKKIPSKSSESLKPIKTATSSSTTTKPEANTKPLSTFQSLAKTPASNSPKIWFQLPPSPKSVKSANSHVKSWTRLPFKTITT